LGRCEVPQSSSKTILGVPSKGAGKERESTELQDLLGVVAF